NSGTEGFGRAGGICVRAGRIDILIAGRFRIGVEGVFVCLYRLGRDSGSALHAVGTRAFNCAVRVFGGLTVSSRHAADRANRMPPGQRKTGNREPATGSREPGTGNREPGTSQHQRETTTGTPFFALMA